MKRRLFALSLSACCAMTLVASSARADTAIVSFTAGDFASRVVGSGGNTIGYSFTANSNLNVTALGLYDLSRDYTAGVNGSLLASHAVGIFSSTGSLLASTTVTPASMLSSGYRYQNIAGLNLIAGQSYLIGAYFNPGDSQNTDAYAFGATNLQTSNAITFGGSAYVLGDSLAAPTIAGSPTGRFGPNFIFSVGSGGAVPEPSSWGMMIVGFGLIGTAMRQRARARSVC